MLCKIDEQTPQEPALIRVYVHYLSRLCPFTRFLSHKWHMDVFCYLAAPDQGQACTDPMYDHKGRHGTIRLLLLSCIPDLCAPAVSAKSCSRTAVTRAEKESHPLRCSRSCLHRWAMDWTCRLRGLCQTAAAGTVSCGQR
jgi:hypothetical protein